ncbi:MAG: dihydroorotate dehydrogenase electron transfer subunit [Candidatus Moranbacteria bacterium]|nr:dihydroorotate dehydrogenase electron transfer subunit [Candidatus Moranbacteria bacterium]
MRLWALLNNFEFPYPEAFLRNFIFKMDQPEIYTIQKTIDEAKDFKTFVFSGSLQAKPGQFVMLWIPGVESKPFSVSYQDNRNFHITVMKVGKFTREMFKLKKGDKVGIQGPYGKGFHFSDMEKRIAIIGGGCGIAPVNFLLHEAKKRNKTVHFIAGCRSKDVFIKDREIKKLTPGAYFMTDDGSFGQKGFTTDALEDLLKLKKIDKIFACGPEKMLYKVAQIAQKNKIRCEISLERFMVCAIGICGQCCIDKSAKRVCKDGPVFKAGILLNSEEFGHYKRDIRGRKVSL